MSTSKLLDFAARLARESGQQLREKWKEQRAITRKSTSSDLVTDADHASESWIVQEIRKHYPEHCILGEECTGNLDDLLQNRSPVWVIDPLDGTVNYAHQLPIFAVSIALIERQRPQIGAIYIPMLEELFLAQTGQGATLNGEPIHVSTRTPLSECVLASGFPYDKHHSARDNVDNFRAAIKQVRGLRRMGAASIDLAYVAAGRFDGYWEEKLKPWDFAAGILLVQEAGGTISHYHPQIQPLRWLRSDIVASNPLIHPHILEWTQAYAQIHNMLETPSSGETTS